MEELIQLKSFPVQTTLNILLKDKTTKKNIIWATKSYESFGVQYSDDRQITVEAIIGLNSIIIQPRIMKAMEQQHERTKNRAEVFTPSWICNQMNNYCDEEWFGRKDVFNIEKEKLWESTTENITFPEKKTWKQYVDSRRLEITCGEAPFIVSRYDAATGEFIEIENRIGILDRKFRVINENTDDETEWMDWIIRAYQSVYGYEFQGDNLLIGRINLLMSFVDYLNYKWNREPTAFELKKIANIIAWNLWQMDGLTGAVPLGVPEEDTYQYSLFDFIDGMENMKEEKTEIISPKCRIYDWRTSHSVLFESLKKEE